MHQPTAADDKPSTGRDNSSCVRYLLVGLGVAVVALVAVVIALAIVYADRRKTSDDYRATIATLRNQLRPACDLSDPAPLVAFPPRVADIFDPFNEAELNAISDYVTATLSISAKETEGDLRGDWIYAIDNLSPNKATALNYIDQNAGTNPGRYALVVVYHLGSFSGSHRVVEYKVGPILSLPIVPASTAITPVVQGHELGTTTEIPYLMRPVSAQEYALMEPLVVAAMAGDLLNLSLVSYGEEYANGRFYWTDSAPRGYTRNDRQTWIWFSWYAEGMFNLPVGLQMLIDHKSLDAADWSIIELGYNGQGPFASPAALGSAFNSGSLTVVNYPYPDNSNASSPLWSSMRRRGQPRPLEERSIPASIEQGGARYAVRGRQVSWLSWDFHIGYELTCGIKINDVRFRNERIVYELALQDAYAAYSGSMPIQALSQYSDGGWGMGWSEFPLVAGVDCPSYAKMLDTIYYVEGVAHVSKNAICIWEQPENVAIMRHYDNNFLGGSGYMFVSAYPRTALVVRTSATVYNYDYTYSYIFHMDGTMVVSSMASGYLQAEHYPTHVPAQIKEKNFGTRINERTMGSLHDHLFGWKIDLDILGKDNRAMRVEKRLGTFPNQFNFGGANNVLKYVHKTPLLTENADNWYNEDPRTPTHFMFHNPTAADGGMNKWGNDRSYAIILPGTSVQLMNASAPWMNAEQWTKYNVAILKRKETEQRSCRVFYDMQAPQEPLVKFDSFFDGDSLVDTDLVAWVMVGSLHFPSSEDAPITTTSGTEVRFLLRPHNYFDENPVTDLTQRMFKTGTLYPDGAAAQDVDTASATSTARCYSAGSPPVYGA